MPTQVMTSSGKMKTAKKRIFKSSSLLITVAVKYLKIFNSNRYPLYSYDKNSEINESSLSMLKVAGCYH